jgi:N-acetylmuramoyl-L-alanine amidase
MAMAIYHESRGESIAGQSGVGYVILNRIRHKGYPKSICGVIHQKGQFGFITKKLKVRNLKEFEESKKIALQIINGEIRNPVGNRLYFNNFQMFKTPNKPIRIGKHVFF